MKKVGHACVQGGLSVQPQQSPALQVPNGAQESAAMAALALRVSRLEAAMQASSCPR
jgi:hypothetical protein